LLSSVSTISDILIANTATTGIKIKDNKVLSLSLSPTDSEREKSNTQDNTKIGKNIINHRKTTALTTSTIASTNNGIISINATINLRRNSNDISTTDLLFGVRANSPN